MSDLRSLLGLKISLMAALGLSTAACGSEVNTGAGAGGASSSSSTTTSSSSSGGSGCQGETPVLLPDGTDSGYRKCADGTIHRANVVNCDPTIAATACQGTEVFMACTTDAECNAAPHGKCLHYEPGFDSPDPTCGCVYSCAQDADCGAGQVCVCNGVVNNGVAWSKCASIANCTTDADCPSGECGITSYNDGCFQQVGLACRDPGDMCRLDSDCMSPVPSPCAVSPYTTPPGAYACSPTNCAIGRPLLVHEKPRTAAPAFRGDWADTTYLPELDGLDINLRQSLAHAWSEIAAFEHASIASFARFSLQLLSLSAPPELLALAQAAAADEIEHARIAYGLASHFAGRDIGPSSLDLSGMTVQSDRLAVLTALIEEACVGETLGAAEALALAGLVRDPALRAVHGRIAEDEGRHAELAWKSLRFLLASADEATKNEARAAFARAMKAASMEPPPRPGPISREHGLLSSQELAEIRGQALREVVRPCMETLLGVLN